MRMTDQIGAYLGDFRARFEPALDSFLKDAHQRMEALDAWGVTLVEAITDFSLHGGKRIRPALVQLGYEAAGGTPDDRLLRPAIAVELMHSFLLIHDDIADRSDVRRHRPTVHRWLRERLPARPDTWSPADRDHYGNSLAIMAGDLCSMLSFRALARADFPRDRITAALRRFIDVVTVTIVGEALDLTLATEATADEQRIQQAHVLKTGAYSLEGPLHLGVILAGGQTELMRQLSRYAIPLGVAFQIQDDVLGVFGSERELGKPVTSDLEEGKQTLLAVYARERATPAQRRRLDAIVGQRHLTKSGLNEARKIFRETGALQRCERQARALVQQGQRSLTQMEVRPRIRHLLFEAAELMITRTT